MQTKDPQTSCQNNSTLVTGLKKIHSLFTKNEELQKDIEKIYDDMNKEHVPRDRDPKTEIENSTKNEIKTQYINAINQINNNSTQIESLISKNNNLKKEIKSLEEVYQTTQQKIDSSKSEINNNNSEIESLVNQNDELMEKIHDIDKNSTS